MTEDVLDAVVIGGGPAGAMAAARLARSGYAVVVLERHVNPRPKVCGEFLSPECVVYLDLIGAGEAFRRLPAVPIEAVALHGGRRVVTMALDPPGWGLSRSVFDDWLLRWAALGGARVLRGYEATAVRREADGFSVRVRRLQDFTEVEFRARHVVGAFGVKSGSRVPFAGLNPPGRRGRALIAFSTHLRIPSIERRVELYFMDHAYVGLASVEDGWVNLAGVVEPAFFRRLGGKFPNLLEYLAGRDRTFRKRLDDASDGTPFRATVHPGFGFGRRTWGDMALIGDRTGAIPPFTGAGIARALQSAFLWAEVMTEGPPDRHPAAVCVEYERRWRQACAAPLRTALAADWLRRRPGGLSILLGLMERYPSVLPWVYRRTRARGSGSREDWACAGSP